MRTRVRCIAIASAILATAVGAWSAPKLKVLTSALPNGTVGQNYSQALDSQGGSPPLTWTISNGSLPSGLMVSPMDGVISGTPVAPGTSMFTVTVVDVAMDTDSAKLSIGINAAVQIDATPLPGGMVGVPYSQPLTASGGTPPYTWTVGSGDLPPGLAISGSSIAGTPTTPGNYSFVAHVTDALGASADQAYSIAVAAGVSIGTATLPAGTVGIAYSQPLSATGGAQPYTWSVAGGTLPPGLSISGSTIAGTPTVAGAYSFDLKVTDAGGLSAQQAFVLNVAAPPVTVTTASLPNATLGVAYSQKLAATGGSGTYTWSVLPGGSLPPGISLSVDTLAGTPTVAGAYQFTVQATDSNNQSGQKQLSITVVAPTLTIATTSLPDATLGAAYSQTLKAAGGVGPYSWSILPGGSLPPGVEFSADTIAGTPTVAGTYQFTVKVTDTSNQTAQQALSITVALPPIGITTTTLPNGTVGTAYSQTLAATGGSGGYTWAIASGSLPAGLTLSGNTIAGTPQTAGASQFVVRVSDDSGHSAQQQLSITIALPPVKVTTTSAASGTVGVPYSQTLAATGGTGTYSWSVASGTLPPGLAITGSAIVGTPSTAGNYTVTVRATDTANSTADQALSIAIAAPVSITACPAGTGLAGQAYSSTATATGGQPPYSWSVSAGQLPPGLALNATSGAVTGSPNQPGAYQFSLRVAESGASTATKSCAITINSPLAITTGSLATASAGGMYAQQLSASGGTAPYTWSVTSGALPPGLTLNGSTGQISGTAGAAGDFTFSVGVADSAGANASRQFTLTVVVGLAITACPAPDAIVNRAYSSAATASGGQTPYTWSLASGLLPDGLSLNNTNGAISGTPTGAGNFDFAVKAVEKGGSSATLACTITVRAGLTASAAPLPEGAVNAQYTYTVAASGGTPPYTWSTTAGALPPGLTLSQSGLISGVPTTPGAYPFTLHVQDQANSSAERQVNITVNPGLTIPACPAPVAETGSPYSSDIAAVGGSTPYSWSINSGALPAGINLDAAAGRLSGTPTATGDFTFTLRVTDAGGRAASHDCAISVSKGLAITTTSLPDAALASAYAQAIAVTGGTPPYAWTTAAGGLPPGLFLNSGTGKITGTPTVAGSFSFTVRVNDSAGAEITQVMTLRVTAGLAITDCPLAVTGVGQPYSATATVQAGTPPLKWSLAGGALPDGLTLDPATGSIAGTPSATGVSDYTLSVADSTGVSAIRACTLTVTKGDLKITTPATLDPAVAGSPYSVTLAVAGGVGAYTWSLTSGALPDGLALDSSGNLAGTPTKTGVFQFSVQVADEGANTAAQAFTLNVLLQAAPAVSITGLSDFAPPAQQPTFGITLDKAYPTDLTGTVQLSFTPDGNLGVDDPAIQFSNGSRTLDFTVPANSTNVQFPVQTVALQTGTVAGTIELNVTLNSSDSGAVGGLKKQVRIDRIAPRITSIEASRTANGVQVVIVGYSTTRDVTLGTFSFTPAGGGAPVQASVPMSDAASQWFQSADSAKFGGEFKVTLPFTFQGGSFSSVTAILNNPQGGSDPASAKF